MSKQIEFLIDDKKENEFIDYLLKEEMLFLVPNLNYNKEVVWIKEDSKIKEQKYLLLYKKEYGDIVYNDIRVKVLESSVIEFMRTMVNKDKKQIRRGRLWINNRLVINEEQMKNYLSGYKKVVSWIKKNIPRQEYLNCDRIYKGYITDEIKELLQMGYKIPY